jgi:POT family proton-dependent oligopeptide transporter
MRPPPPEHLEATANAPHPKGLYLLFFTEMWERFSYYGMRAIFILFMTKALFMGDADASNVYGSFTGLVYLTPLLGGYISDRFWGNRRSILVGGILMAIGQFLLFFSGSLVTAAVQSPGSISAMWAGLTLLIIGNGFFKPNISTMVGQLYPPNDRRIDGAFTIFYMGINLGALFSPLICGGLGNTGSIFDFKWGFLAASIGMVIGTLSFELLKKKHLVDAQGGAIGMPRRKMDMKTVGIIIGSVALMFFLLNFKTWFNLDLDLIGYLIVAAFIAMPIIVFSDKALGHEEKQRISVVFILAFFVIFFWACFEQAGASLTLFADRQVDRVIHILVPSWLILACGLVIVYFLGNAIGWFFDWSKKLKLGIQGCLGVLLVVLYFMGWITNYERSDFPASWFQSVNPLAIILLAPLFSMLWDALGKRGKEPSSPLKMAMGLALLSIGYMVIAFGVHGVDSSIKISMWWLITLYVLHTMGELCLSPIGLSMVSKMAPLRFSSLLMGTWFLANALANVFAGSLSALIPPGAGEAKAAAETHFPTFLGFTIDNLFHFFIVFIVLSGSAAILLLGIHRWLQKRMHGVN